MSRRAAYPYAFWMALFVVAPLVIMVFYAFTNDDGRFTLESFSKMQSYAPVFARSLVLALIATVICILLGYPAAYLLSKEGPKLQGIGMMLVMLPMWMNFLLRTYAWMTILENTGLLNQFLTMIGLPPVQIINTQGAIVLGMVYNYLPFMIIPILTVMQKIDLSLIEAAQDLGCNSRTVFRKVILPLSLPGVLSGITMVFVPCVSTFIISKLLGGGGPLNLLLGDLIEMQFLGNSYNLHLGSAISLVMMVIVLAGVGIINKFVSKEDVILL